jgi:hypothetical protein
MVNATSTQSWEKSKPIEVNLHVENRKSVRFNDYATLYYQWSNSPELPESYSSKIVFHTDEDGEVQSAYCGWQNHFDAETGRCTFDLSVFEQRPDGSYDRADEQQEEQCYSESVLRSLLERTGFEVLGVFGDFDRSVPESRCERWHFVARCKK